MSRHGPKKRELLGSQDPAGFYSLVVVEHVQKESPKYAGAV